MLPLNFNFQKFKKQLPIEELMEGHKKAQDLAYRCALEIAQDIQIGWSEKKTAALMDQWLLDYGVQNFFHKSFAWFGKRTQFYQFKSQLDFLPKTVTLEPEDVIILDTAPILNGFTADIGFTFSKTPNKKLTEARQFLLSLRQDIQEKATSLNDLGSLWKEIDQHILQKGYKNCHKKYPFAVLGHKVHFIDSKFLPQLQTPFSLHAIWSLVSRGLMPELLTSKHSGSKDGLWAIEPHLGVEDLFGIKFEEILVIHKNKTMWLSENVPHLNLPKGLY